MWTPWIPSPVHPTRWAPPASGPRRALIDLLLRASALMVRTAVRLQRAPLITPVRTASASASAPVEPVAAAPMPLPAREFYAEAGAPEGALYVDGQFIGRLPGVPRL